MVKWRTKAVEGAQWWALMWRDRRKFYFIISSFFLTVGKSAETGGWPFLSGLSQKKQFDGWLANSGFLSKCPTSPCSFVLVMTIMYLPLFLFFLISACHSWITLQGVRSQPKKRWETRTWGHSLCYFYCSLVHGIEQWLIRVASQRSTCKAYPSLFIHIFVCTDSSHSSV